MSQFDLPRINFHGTALLDTATANNGNYETGLTMFDQDNSTVFMPPRCYLNPKNPPYNPPQGVIILTDQKGQKYVPLEPITSDNYQDWAITPLGSFGADSIYKSLYENLGLIGSNPGYWNYFGDLSMSIKSTKVTGITMYENSGNPATFTPENQESCPSDLAGLFGSDLSFKSDYFSPDSRTTAYLSDVDSIGQMCTQIFCGTAGLYKKDAQGNNITFFKGSPVKSTARWMNLTKVLNYSDNSLLPMGGSACFYAKIELEPCPLLDIMSKYTGTQVTSLFLKMMIHEVYETREPIYKLIPKLVTPDNPVGVPKNPAQCSISGSISPFFEGDMKTASVCRLLKNKTPLSIDTSAIPPAVTNKNGPIKVPTPFPLNLAPIQLYHNKNLNLLSVDILNTISEYGNGKGVLEPYAGPNDIYPFTSFESYQFGSFELNFKLDSDGSSFLVKSIDFANNYNMNTLLSTGGVVDIPIQEGTDFSKGSFFITLDNNNVFIEDDYLISSDQMGNYAQQNQTDSNYMSDGLPKLPCTLSVFYRGQAVDVNSKISVTQQNINMRTGSIVNIENVMIYNGKTMDFPVDTDGCVSYAFIDKESDLLKNGFPNLFNFVLNNGLIVVRTLERKSNLEPYLNGSLPITWDVVFQNVFILYKTLYPIMDAIIPFTEANWSNSFILSKMELLMDDKNWNKPLYMPVTRDMTYDQQQLLKMWTNQIANQATNQPNQQSIKNLFNLQQADKYPISIIVENIENSFQLPALQSFSYAVYKNYWIFIGGETKGFHGTSNDPPPFLTTFANTKIWVLDLNTMETYNRDLPSQYLISLAVSNAQFYQDNDILYLCGGYAVSDLSQSMFNTTSDNIFRINLPNLISYVISNSNEQNLDEIFEFCIQDSFVRVTGGALVLVADIFYLIGGQDYEGNLSPGQTGTYTEAIRSFTILKGSNGWSINNKNTLTDTINLHRRDFNLVPYLGENSTQDYILYGGVFTPDNVSYNNPIYIKGLLSGQPTITVGEFSQKCNQYTCGSISFLLYPGSGMIYALLGGISYMKYDETSKQLVIGDNGVPMPFSNLIDFLVTDSTETMEYVQLPPNAILPGYLGSNACFIPLDKYISQGTKDIIDLEKVFNTLETKIPIGYLYGGILSDGPTSGTTANGHVNTYANKNVYTVYIQIDTDSIS